MVADTMFALSADAVPHVARLLRAVPAGWEGTAVKARRRSPRTVLHLYLAPTSPSATRRIRVKPGRKPPVLLLESKRLLREDLFLAQKVESTDDPEISLADAWGLMTAPGAVISAFIKNQYQVYLSCDAGAFKASLDQVIPFSPRLPLTTAAPSGSAVELLRCWRQRRRRPISTTIASGRSASSP